MGIAIAHLAAEQPSVRCRICQREAPRGAKLCGECAAAVKRARHVPTVTSQFLPLTATRSDWASPRLDWAPRKTARPRASPSADRFRSWLPTRPAGWGVLVAFAIFGVTICVTGYFAVQEIEDTVGHPGMPSAVASLTTTTEHPSTTTESSETWMFAKPAVRDDAAPSEGAPLPNNAYAAAPVPNLTARKPVLESRIARTGATTADPRAAGRMGYRESTPVQSEEANAAPIVPQVARAEIPAASPGPDRWDAMNAALARCSGEGFLAGLMCTERARMQYCDGFWGAVPQCRAASSADNSR